LTHVVMAETIIVIATIIAASFATTAIVMNLDGLVNTFRVNERNIKDKIQTQITIVFATINTNDTVKVWIKNTGIKEIHEDLIPKSDLFFGPKGNFKRIPYETSTASPPRWNYTIVNDVDGDGNWDPGETIEVTIIWDTALDLGEYYVKFVLYNGVDDDYTFSI